MPAAIPIIAAVAPAVIGGKIIGDRSAQSAHDKQISAAQAGADANWQAQDAYRSGIMPKLEDVYGMSMAPQESFGSSRSVQNVNQLQAPELMPGGQGMFDMLKTRYMGDAAAANFVPEGILQSSFQDIAAQERAAEGDIENRARAMGVDPTAMKLASPVFSGANRARNEARRGAEQERFSRGQLASGNIDQLLRTYKLGSRLKGKTTGYNSFKNTGPANVGGALAAIQAGRPQDKDVIV